MMARRTKHPTVSVLGAGNWGTTVAHLIAEIGHVVVLWCRRKEHAQDINKSHDTLARQNVRIFVCEDKILKFCFGFS